MLTLTSSFLDHGWAQVSLSKGGESLTLIVSSPPSAALDPLVDAVIAFCKEQTQ